MLGSCVNCDDIKRKKQPNYIKKKKIYESKLPYKKIKRNYESTTTSKKKKKIYESTKAYKLKMENYYKSDYLKNLKKIYESKLPYKKIKRNY